MSSHLKQLTKNQTETNINIIKPGTIGYGKDNFEVELFIGSTFSGDLNNSDVIEETITKRFEERYGFNTYKK